MAWQAYLPHGDKFEHVQRFDNGVSKAMVLRRQAAAARLAGDETTAEACLSTLAIGDDLRLLLQEHGVPEDVAAEAGAAINQLKLEDGDGFYWFVRGIRDFIHLRKLTDVVNEQLDLCAAPAFPAWAEMTGKDWAALLYYCIWWLTGGFLSRGIFGLGLTPYGYLMTVMPQTFIWILAGAWVGGDRIIGCVFMALALAFWLRNHRTEMLPSMAADVVRLRSMAHDLQRDAEVWPVRLRPFAQARVNRSCAVLQKLRRAHSAAQRAHSHVDSVGTRLVSWAGRLRTVGAAWAAAAPQQPQPGGAGAGGPGAGG